MRYYAAIPHGENGKIDPDATPRIIKAPLANDVHKHINKKLWTVRAATSDDLVAAKGKHETVDVSEKEVKAAPAAKRAVKKSPAGSRSASTTSTAASSSTTSTQPPSTANTTSEQSETSDEPKPAKTLPAVTRRGGGKSAETAAQDGESAASETPAATTPAPRAPLARKPAGGVGRYRPPTDN